MSQALDPIAASYMAVPQLTVATGYNARVLVPQGTFYDPFFPIAGEGDDIWLNNGEKKEKAVVDFIASNLLVQCPHLSQSERFLLRRGLIVHLKVSRHTQAKSSFAQPKRGWAGAPANLASV